MTKEEAIQILEHSIKCWEEFWDGASYTISEDDLEAIRLLIDEAKKK